MPIERNRMGLVYVTTHKYDLKRVHTYVVKFSEQLHLYMRDHRERIIVKSHDIVPMYQQSRMVLYGHFVYVFALRIPSKTAMLLYTRIVTIGRKLVRPRAMCLLRSWSGETKGFSANAEHSDGVSHMR